MNLYCGCQIRELEDGSVVLGRRMKVDKIGVEQSIIDYEHPKTGDTIVHKHYPNVDRRVCPICGAVVYMG